MEIIVDKIFQHKLIQTIETREFHERTNVHSTDLSWCINKQALRKLEPTPNTEKETLLFSVGFMAQRWVVGIEHDVPEITVDGITTTLDALVCPKCWKVSTELLCSCGGKSVPLEFKATYQSSNRPIEDNLSYIRQVMSQCYVTNTTEAYISRLCLMGDWKIKEGNRPILDAFHFTFKPEELNRWWAVMLERRDLFLGILETGNLLPLGVALLPGQEYECNFCPYKDRCK